MIKRQNIIDKFWKDSSGKQALVERPNIPLAGWFVFVVAGKLVGFGKIDLALDYLAFGFLFTWAWLEFYSGNSYFRRVLGLLVLILVTYNKIK